MLCKIAVVCILLLRRINLIIQIDRISKLVNVYFILLSWISTELQPWESICVKLKILLNKLHFFVVSLCIFRKGIYVVLKLLNYNLPISIKVVTFVRIFFL